MGSSNLGIGKKTWTAYLYKYGFPSFFLFSFLSNLFLLPPLFLPLLCSIIFSSSDYYHEGISNVCIILYCITEGKSGDKKDDEDGDTTAKEGIHPVIYPSTFAYFLLQYY